MECKKIIILLIFFLILTLLTIQINQNDRFSVFIPRGNNLDLDYSEELDKQKSSNFSNEIPSVDSSASKPHLSKNGLNQDNNNEKKLNGVIMFLYGGRYNDYFLNYTLPSLEAYFLRCYAKKYPVHIFYEEMAYSVKEKIISLIPSALRVDFEDVSLFWKVLPHNLTEEQVKKWVKKQGGHGRGYRVMCRFWAGLVWQLPSLDNYTHYWRLDTDSILLRQVPYDPFFQMQTKGCEYGYNSLRDDAGYVIVGLFKAFNNWVKNKKLINDEVFSKIIDLSTRKISFFDKIFGSNNDDSQIDNRYIIRGKKVSFIGPMFYNNFELGTMKLKRSKIYQSFFNYVDSTPPYGIFRYRWGDAPIHTLGVYSALNANESLMCNFNSFYSWYGHSLEKPPPIDVDACKEISKKSLRLHFYLPIFFIIYFILLYFRFKL